jgi:phytoene dehydrogenase-like protein
MYDVIVIGAGFGGLTCAANLAKYGKKVLLLEKVHHIGGTSYIFKRDGYYFPMGPLSFSSPEVVLKILRAIGVEQLPRFIRNQFRLVAPGLDIMYSQPFHDLKMQLKAAFKGEERGIDAFFDELEILNQTINDLEIWNPEYRVEKISNKRELDSASGKKLELLKKYSLIPAQEVLKKYIRDRSLQNFLGTQGTYTPRMSMFLLAIMWRLVSEMGIWFPSGGIHGILDSIYGIFSTGGGEARLSTPVKEIRIDNERAQGVMTAKGNVFEAKWVVSNVDYKKTFLELIPAQKVPKEFLELVENRPYFGSELCVYLGIDPQKVKLDGLGAQHLFYRKLVKSEAEFDLTDFDNREIEIYLLSQNAPDATPPEKASLILRVGFPYDFFEEWGLGEKKRKKGYLEFKKKLAEKLVKTVEILMPGLTSSIEVMEIATPLTYQDWGQRYRGSIAGWSWAAENNKKFSKKLLIETPIQNLLMVGMYSAAELFLGGVPTAMHTGYLASQIILNDST